ncbi:hypothetical protein [Agrobacterium tumefaciens]|uniref:5'-methylthioadenosine/S-adenosylhomocysteine nucleosidase family protein n=1 Tax=Agrobacterium tumefaciens TaxID=358 RepID=UPI003B9F3FF9
MPTHGRSVYLHFFDRELGESVQRTVTGNNVQISLKLLSVLTGSALNCSASIFFESPAINSSSSLAEFTQLLLRTGHLDILSSHPTLAEFFESRATLYTDDRDRYPMYFGKSSNIPETFAIIPKSTSATLSLAIGLSAWGADLHSSSDAERDAKRVVSESMIKRADRAVTAALFSTATEASRRPELAIGLIRREISVQYTKHFMESLNSDIATGIDGLKYFDNCSINFPAIDIPILFDVAKTIGLGNLMKVDWLSSKAFWENYFHSSSQFDGRSELHEKMHLLGASLAGMFRSDISNKKETFRIFVQQTLRTIGSQVAHTEINAGSETLGLASSRLEKVLGILSQNLEFRTAMEAARVQAQGNTMFDYVIVVATDIERNAVFEAVRNLGGEPEPKFGGNRAYFDCGYIHGNRVAVVKVAMGSVSVGGSISTTMQITSHLKPKHVIMVGIAFGMDESKYPIGTVLVSRQVLGYELQRVGSDEHGEPVFVSRGSRTDASPRLVSLIETAAAVWNNADVKIGLLLSGDKLVDNLDFREKLQNLAGGDAIGGEMEGIGLVVALAEKPTHWVIVKAVCDWADGNKSDDKESRQVLAARNAVSLVFRAMKIVPDSEGS